MDMVAVSLSAAAPNTGPEPPSDSELARGYQ
jgi:hypothetical protein